MRLLIKSLIMFTLIFILFFPLSIVMDSTFSNIDEIASQYSDSEFGNGTTESANWTANVTTHTSFFGNVFRIIYSIAGVGIIINMVLIAVLRDDTRYLYEN